MCSPAHKGHEDLTSSLFRWLFAAGIKEFHSTITQVTLSKSIPTTDRCFLRIDICFHVKQSKTNVTFLTDNSSNNSSNCCSCLSGLATVNRGFARFGNEPYISKHELTTAMQHLFSLYFPSLEEKRRKCQELVRFCVYYRIKPHAPPLG